MEYRTENFIKVNVHPKGLNVKDCVVRAVSTAFNKDYLEVRREGYGFLEIGKMLENDGIERKDGAYLKYGENHSKTALEIGLLFCLSGKYFLSCLGYVFNDLSEEERKSLLVRLILRNKLVMYLLIYSRRTFYENDRNKATQGRVKSLPERALQADGGVRRDGKGSAVRERN